jgi:hypothetical protein
MLKDYLIFLIAIGMFWSAAAHFGMEHYSPEDLAALFKVSLMEAINGVSR